MVGDLIACVLHILAPLLELHTVDNVTRTKDMHVIP